MVDPVKKRGPARQKKPTAEVIDALPADPGAPGPGTELVAQDPAGAPSMISAQELLSRAVDKGAPIETLERLMALREKIVAEEAKKTFNVSMALFQAACPVIEKTKEVKDNNKKVLYKYAPLDVIVSQVKGILQKYGFSYAIKTKQDGGTLTVVCIVKHRDGWSEESDVQVPSTGGTSIMSGPQKTAAALTFAKRYAFCNAFGIMTGDEDTDTAHDRKDNEDYVAPPPPPAPAARTGAPMPPAAPARPERTLDHKKMTVTDFLEIINEDSTPEAMLLKTFAAAKTRSDFALEDRQIISRNFVSHLARKRGVEVTAGPGNSGFLTRPETGEVVADLVWSDGWVSVVKPGGQAPAAPAAPAPHSPPPPAPPSAPAPVSPSTSPVQAGHKPGTAGGTAPVPTEATAASSREMSGDQWVRLQEAGKAAGKSPVQLEEYAREYFQVPRAAELHPEAAEQLIEILNGEAAGGAPVDIAAEAMAVFAPEQGTAAAAPVAAPIEQRQIARIHVLEAELAKKLKIPAGTAEMVRKDVMGRMFPGVDSSKNLTSAQADQLIKSLIETYGLPVGPPPPPPPEMQQ